MSSRKEYLKVVDDLTYVQNAVETDDVSSYVISKRNQWDCNGIIKLNKLMAKGLDRDVLYAVEKSTNNSMYFTLRSDGKITLTESAYPNVNAEQVDLELTKQLLDTGMYFDQIWEILWL